MKYSRRDLSSFERIVFLSRNGNGNKTSFSTPRFVASQHFERVSQGLVLYKRALTRRTLILRDRADAAQLFRGRELTRAHYTVARGALLIARHLRRVLQRYILYIYIRHYYYVYAGIRGGLRAAVNRKLRERNYPALIKSSVKT